MCAVDSRGLDSVAGLEEAQQVLDEWAVEVLEKSSRSTIAGV